MRVPYGIYVLSYHILQYCKKINIINKSSWKTSQKFFPFFLRVWNYPFVSHLIFISSLAYPSIFFAFSILPWHIPISFAFSFLPWHIHLYPLHFLFFPATSIYILRIFLFFPATSIYILRIFLSFPGIFHTPWYTSASIFPFPPPAFIS